MLLISSIMGLSMAAGTPPVTKLAAVRRLVHHSPAGGRAEAGAGREPGRMAKCVGGALLPILQVMWQIS